jgi:hypothetical protein
VCSSLVWPEIPLVSTLIAQSTLKLTASIDEACSLICEHVHPALEALVKDEGEDVCAVWAAFRFAPSPSFALHRLGKLL